jgi:xylan 1,4-beta-xylosidase
MKTSDNKIFYWQGNTSHPEPHKWAGLVDAFVHHVEDRYGKEEVRSWYFEVWNKPNLDGFWEKADKNAYFALYGLTARTIKSVDPMLKVGGPSTAGIAWIPEFIKYTTDTQAPLDFITTHTYGVDGGFLDEEGHSDTKLSPAPDAIIGDVRYVRKEISESARPDLPLYFTEWSTSYSPRDAVHDTYISAPYILSKLKASQGLLQGMSYWTFSDLFEEPGPPTAPFQGGFGLMNPEGIRKPAYFAYKYLNQLGDQELKTDDAQSFVTRKGKAVQVLVWDLEQPVQDKSNRPFFTKVLPTKTAAPVMLTMKGLKSRTYQVHLYRTGFQANDAYTAYLKLGSPKSLSTEQIKQLDLLTADQPETAPLMVSKSGTAQYSIPMHASDVVLVTIEPK